MRPLFSCFFNVVSAAPLKKKKKEKRKKEREREREREREIIIN